MPEPPALAVPEDLRTTLLAAHRRDWARWLDDLPEIVARYAEAWELEVGEAFPASYSFVAPARRGDGIDCVLKLAPPAQPDEEGAGRELRALRLAGDVAARIFADDVAEGALLLERAIPGDDLRAESQADDDATTEVLGGVIGRFSRPLDDPGSVGLPEVGSLASCFERFDRGPHGEVARSKAAARPGSGLVVLLGLDERSSALPAVRSARTTAERVLAELEADKPVPVLLHGDLHHGNVLHDEERGLIVIDAKGFVGDAAYEVATAMHNPWAFLDDVDDLAGLFRRRLAIYRDVLGLEEDRMAAWCYVNAVFSALWTIEDGGSVEAEDTVVRTIAGLRSLI